MNVASAALLVADAWAGKPFTPRAGKWPSLRKRHLKLHPSCLVCGATDYVEVHHRWPVHLFPDRELDPESLSTLCTKGPGFNCHLVAGHGGNWHDYMPDPVAAALALRAILASCVRAP
jgi:5-methylcytosine-specific restriction protein A